MKKLAKKVLFLLEYNHNRESWSCGLEDKETWKVITAIAQHSEFSEIIDIEIRKGGSSIFSKCLTLETKIHLN